MAKKSSPALTDFPAYAAEKNKLDALTREADELEADIQRICAGRLPARARLEAEAKALLAGEIVPPDPDPAELQRRVEVLKVAIGLQIEVVANLRRESSRTICARLFPEHKAIVARIGKAFAELHAAMTAERQFREALELNDVIVAAPITAMQAPLDLDNYLEHWQSDLKHAGYLD